MSNTSDDRAPTGTGAGEQEPLLGRPGDASQPKEEGLYQNLILGTGVVAQAGAWILLAIVWGSVFSHPDKLMLFSAHPVCALLFLFSSVYVYVQCMRYEGLGH